MPTLEDILPNLANAKVFSVLDAKEGFWHIKLEESSSFLTTFWTPFGRYRWLRLPFGISSAPEEFQRRQHEVLEGLSGAECVMDDIIVYGCGETMDSAIHDQGRIQEFWLGGAWIFCSMAWGSGPALRPPVGPGQRPGGFPGGEAPGTS